MAVGQSALLLKVEEKDATGAARVWNLEFGNPTDITLRGFRRNTFKVGGEITVTVTPVKSGAPMGGPSRRQGGRKKL